MIPTKLSQLMTDKGNEEHYEKNKIYHAQNFEHRLFKLEKGYVKRYQVTNNEDRVIELIYGPGHIFPLSQLYKEIFGIEQNQKNFIYVYQAMTDIDAYALSTKVVMNEIEHDPLLYIDLYYESGLRLKSNIDRLASNSFRDNYKKVAHQIVMLANDFGVESNIGGHPHTKILVPLEAIDIAEQINISTNDADSILDNLNKRGLITYKNNHIFVKDMDLLQDVYLAG